MWKCPFRIRFLGRWPDWTIFCTFGNFLKPLATISLPKSPTFLGNFCKGVKIYHFWATFIDIWWFFSGHTGCGSTFHHECISFTFPGFFVFVHFSKIDSQDCKLLAKLISEWLKMIEIYEPIFLTKNYRSKLSVGGSPGLVVMGDDSCREVVGSDPIWYRYWMDITFFHIYLL